MKNNLPNNLKKIRKENNLSQEQLAEKLNVTRQAVSKWESGVAYPEMDKVIQMCQIFDLNIDELLNKDIKKVNEENKLNLNKYIDSVLEYIAKTVKMFSNFSIKEKIKCLVEEFFVSIILFIVFMIIGSIIESAIYSLDLVFPDFIFRNILSISKGLYIIISLIVAIFLLCYIFKIRYLDYFEFVKNDKEEKKEKINNEVKEKKVKVLEEKIIIRDPKHSEYKFINGLLKIIIGFIKFIMLIILLPFLFTLICLVTVLVLSILFINMGLTFIGGFIILISMIVVNLIIIIIINRFITNKKTYSNIFIILIIISLLLCGVGFGLILMDVPNYNIIDKPDEKLLVTKEQIIEYEEGMYFEEYYINNINYKIENRSDIKIEYKTYDFVTVYLEGHSNVKWFSLNINEKDTFRVIRLMLGNFKKKELIDYNYYEITVYLSEDNLKKMELNRLEYYQNQ